MFRAGFVASLIIFCRRLLFLLVRLLLPLNRGIFYLVQFLELIERRPAMAERIIITLEQHNALQRPAVLPTPAELFEFERDRLITSGLAKPSDFDGLDKELPSGLFILVPPRLALLDLNHFMSLVVVDGKSGVNYLNASSLIDEIAVPHGAYLMADVEDGFNRRGKKPSVNLAEILAESRSPYITIEGIVHTILFPSVLTSHFMDLVGSRYLSGGRPRLCLGGGLPKLDGSWGDDADPRWGAPSCARRISA